MATLAQIPIVEHCRALLDDLGVNPLAWSGGTLPATSPITGESLGAVHQTAGAELNDIVDAAVKAQLVWREVPAPIRGELVRLFGDELRAAKTALGSLVTLEAGKIASEGLGEVQEMIDICTFAAGLSRQLYGLTIATERTNHRMMETWHPLGVVGIISAFNFPVAVWSWNAALALICGNTCVWKPSEKTPLCALAVQALFERAVARFQAEGNPAPPDLSSLLIGDGSLGQALVAHKDVTLISATGSVRMGRAVGPVAAARFARLILELGGNNAAIVCPSADLHLTLQGVAFSAMGTAGQRCTTMRRLFVHDHVYERLVAQLQEVYERVPVGDPRAPSTIVGPLIDTAALEGMNAALDEARSLGGTVTGGGRALTDQWPEAAYVRPAMVEMPGQSGPVLRETFAPILYVMRYRNLHEAIALHNAVPQGLSSSIFTTDLREAEYFLSARGSDCGLANVNLGTSGAEIGGAFGGEKETGGGRESGSDSWKSYMRRATNVINYGRELPLAQGVTFAV